MKLLFAFSFALLHVAAAAAAPGDFEIRGPYGGDVRSLAISPHASNVLLAGTSDGQVFRSLDSGGHWERTAGVGRGWVVDNLLFDPEEAGAVYAATWDLGGSGGGLYRSRDNGFTWVPVPVVDRPISIRALALADKGATLLVGALDGVHLSRDRGATWKLISAREPELINVESVAVDPGDSRILYAGTWHLGAKSTDGGETWSWVKQGMADDSDLFSIAVHPEKTDIVYASACSGIYKSNDGGRLWKRLLSGLPAEAKRTRSIYIDPVDRERIYAGTTQGLFRSGDAGATWKRISAADLTINAVVVNPRNNDEVFLATDDAGIVRSVDGGKTFQAANVGFTHRNVTQIAGDPRDGRRLYASVLFDRAYGGFFVSEDGGGSWTQSNAGLPAADADVYAILPSSRGDRILIGTSSGIYVSADRGGKWSKLTPAVRSAAVTKMLRAKVLQLQFLSADEATVAAATTGGLYIGDLKTGKWTRPVIPQYNGDIYSIYADPEQKALFAASRVGLFLSRDSGKTWRLGSGLPNTSIHTIERAPGRGVLVVGTGHGLYRSQDDGETWAAVTHGIPPVDISILTKSFDGRSLYAADFVQGNVYASHDWGLSWSPLTRGINSGVSTLVVSLRDGSELLLGSRSDGIYFLRAQGAIDASAPQTAN